MLVNTIRINCNSSSSKYRDINHLVGLHTLHYFRFYCQLVVLLSYLLKRNFIPQPNSIIRIGTSEFDMYIWVVMLCSVHLHMWGVSVKSSLFIL